MGRVLVGMSGGVDSSVAAALLARAGHEVIGVSLQLYDHSEGGRASRCCSPEDLLDARRVAAQVGFPYYVINQEEAFRREVLDPFARDYREGRTPNPCVRCNSEVKFEALFDLADRLGAHTVATGHYARLERGPVTGEPRLLRARDHAKDQSYFLFDVEPRLLSRTIFPLGELTKAEVRAEAQALGLATALKPESQDVCFVEGGDYRTFLRRHRRADEPGEEAGEIVDRDGRVLGRHDGISGFTIGQRRGLGVASSRRLYVLQVEAGPRRVVLGEEEHLWCGALELSGVRLAADSPATGATRTLRAQVRVRYRHEGAPARIIRGASASARVEFESPVRGVSPGQAAVFYDGDRVLGGGWIERALAVTASTSGAARAAEPVPSS